MLSFISLYDLHPLTYDVTGAEHCFELLKQETLDLCHPYLYSIGFDTNKQICIQACKHRSVSKGVVVGYRVIGWQRQDKIWRQDRRCNLHVHQNSLDFKTGTGFDLTDYALEHDAIPMTLSEVEEDYDDVTKQLKALRDVLVHVRGNKDLVF